LSQLESLLTDLSNQLDREDQHDTASDNTGGGLMNNTTVIKIESFDQDNSIINFNFSHNTKSLYTSPQSPLYQSPLPTRRQYHQSPLMSPKSPLLGRGPLSPLLGRGPQSPLLDKCPHSPLLSRGQLSPLLGRGPQSPLLSKTPIFQSPLQSPVLRKDRRSSGGGHQGSRRPSSYNQQSSYRRGSSFSAPQKKSDSSNR